MDVQTIVTIVIGILSSAALFSFIQFLISRRDKKKEKKDEENNCGKKILASLETTNKDIDKIITEEIPKIYSSIDQVIASMNDKMDLHAAIQARVRILSASDEIRRKELHSEEFFDQLMEDITLYEHFCENHLDFKNNKAVQAIKNINEVYQRCLKENTFL